LLAALPIILPHVEEWPLGLKTRRLAKQVRVDRDDATAAATRANEARAAAEEARKVAHVYYAVAAALSMLPPSLWMHPTYARQLLRLADEEGPVSLDEFVRRLGEEGVPVDQGRSTGGVRNVLELLAGEQILRLGWSEDEETLVEVRREAAPAVQAAFKGLPTLDQWERPAEDRPEDEGRAEGGERAGESPAESANDADEEEGQE